MPTLVQPDLFEQSANPPRSLLPNDGTAYDYGAIMAATQADQCFLQLQNEIDWQLDQL